MYCRVSLIAMYWFVLLAFFLLFSVSFLYSICSVKTVVVKAYGKQTDCNLSETGFLESKRCHCC